MTEYENIHNRIRELGFTDSDLPIMGTNYENDPIIISRGSVDGNNYYEIQTAQKNDWVRINCYYADGQADETCERGAIDHDPVGDGSFRKVKHKRQRR